MNEFKNNYRKSIIKTLDEKNTESNTSKTKSQLLH